MKKVTLYFALLALAVSSFAQSLAMKPGTQEQAETITFEFTSTDQLRTDGWIETEPGIWHKTLEHGVEVEFALGAPAIEKALQRLDTRIESLRALDELTARQELKLLDLLLQREELTRTAMAETKYNPTRSVSLCTGTASFSHSYGFYGAVYPFASSQAQYHKFSTAGTATTFTQARICGSGICRMDEDESEIGAPVFAFPASPPAWTCDANAYGHVMLGGALPPTNCERFASFSSRWFCTR